MATTPGETTQLVYVVIFGLAAAVSFLSILRARKVDDRETRYGLVGLLVGSGGWAASHAGLFVLPTAGLRIGSYAVGLVLGFSTVFSWLYFCSAYSGRNYHRTPRLRWAGLATYLTVVGVKVTNPLHEQYFVATVVSESPLYVEIQQQAFHWMATGLAYALAGVGLFMLFERYAEAGYNTRPLVVLTGLTALPVVFDVAGFTSGIVLNVIYAPLGVAVFAIGVLFVYQDRFLAVQLTGDVDEPFVFLDDEGHIRDFNERARALFPALEGSRNEPAGEVRGLETVFGSEGDVLDVRVDGETRHYFVGSSSFTLGGSDIGEVLLFSDVTDIEQQRRELQRHNEQLEEFAAGIRHELRNSLQVIKMRVNAAGGALEDGEVSTARESLSAASDRTNRMSRTVSDLATLAQYGKSIGSRDRIPFRETVEGAWSTAETSDLSLAIEGEGTVEADPARLQNLFESVFVFARHNEATTVTVALTESGFVVSDDGTRPADENLGQLFDYGHAVPNAEAGMALPNVETLAEVHDWSVDIDDSYYEGVRLVISGVAVTLTGTASAEAAEGNGGPQVSDGQ